MIRLYLKFYRRSLKWYLKTDKADIVVCPSVQIPQKKCTWRLPSKVQ